MASLIKTGSQRGSGSRSSSVASTQEGYGLKRTYSTSSSIFSYIVPNKQEKEMTDEEHHRIVIYDPLQRKLLVEKKEKLETYGDSVKCPIRGTDTKVSVYMETGPVNEKAKIFIATVDLGRLGGWVKTQRKKKRMQHLYVLGQMPMGFAPVAEEESAG